MGSIYRPTYTDRHGKKCESANWSVQYWANGRRIRESTETADYNEAKTFLRRKEGLAASGKIPRRANRRITFGELAEDLKTEYEANHRRTIRDLKIRLNKHILPEFGKARASSITGAEINAYIVKRQGEGAENGTINRELAAIRRAFNLGVEHEKIALKPHISTLKENNVRKGFLEREQLDELIRYLRPHNQPVALFGFITGWRKAEILGLTWPRVDFEAGTVRLEPGETKNDEARTFPMTRELRDLLEAQRSKAVALQKRGILTPWVFFWARGKRIGDNKHNWKTACKAAGYPGQLFHDLRRSAVRNLIRSGVSERVAMQLTGHRTRSVFDRYNITNEQDLRDAISKLEAKTADHQPKTPAKVRAFRQSSNNRRTAK